MADAGRAPELDCAMLPSTNPLPCWSISCTWIKTIRRTVAEVPDALPRAGITPEHLPVNWREAVAPPELTRLGDEFVRRRERCLMMMPSALAPAEYNCLINPEHPDFRKIIVREVAPLAYDPRMFRRRQIHRRG